MKLAEALVLRADSQKRIEQLKQRLLVNAKVQEGDDPAEDPMRLLAEINQVATDLTRLIRQINRTNVTTEFESGVTLTDTLAERDVLRIRHGVYRDLAQAASISQSLYSRSEVKFRSTVDVAALQQQADELARQYRDLDTRIQELNWRTELAE
jgi:hypothetical protein